MNNFTSALDIISELVKDFNSNKQHCLNSSYTEADVRNDFIKKFYITLGWGVRHKTFDKQMNQLFYHLYGLTEEK